MDIPEYARLKRPGAPAGEPVTQADRDYHANRSRGLGGNPTTGAEENLLGYPGTRYYGEHIFVHEFAHAIMTGLRDADPALHAEIRAAYDAAMARQEVHLRRQPRAALRDDQRQRVLGGRRAVVVLLELRRVLRRQHQGRQSRRVQGLRSDAVRDSRPRVRRPSHPDGRVPWPSGAEGHVRRSGRHRERIAGPRSSAFPTCASGFRLPVRRSLITERAALAPARQRSGTDRALLLRRTYAH